MEARLGYCKVCEFEDFADPTRRRYMSAIFARAGRSPAYAPYVPGREHRKLWEVAQAARTLHEFHALHASADVLGVAAGIEETTFWATNLARRVFATDLYLDAGAWEAEAPRAMLTEPGRFATCAWNPRRLVVQHMDARELRYEDDSFYGVYCSSSLEHFGGPSDAALALTELHRVLQPGGIASISTEYRLRGPGPGIPGTLIFDAAELDELIVRPYAWELVQPLDLTISEQTLATEQSQNEAIAGSRWPHIVLREGELAWTSVHLALRKDR
jgi:SAM-dependent methyltransferase